MTKSKSTVDEALKWLGSASKKVASSRPVNERYSSEWKNTKVYAAHDKESLAHMVAEKKAFYNSYSSHVDAIKVRASGSSIGHGRIPITEGAKAYSALYELIKHSAKNTLKGKASVQKALEEYLESCFILAPQAGSFIYTAEFDLKHYSTLDEYHAKATDDLFEDCQGDLIRSLNENLARNLLKLNNFTKEHKNPSYTYLATHGIDRSLCDNFLTLFSKSAENLEFSFDWSTSCKMTDKSLPTMVVFEESTKQRFKSYKETLIKAKNCSFDNITIYIESLSVPMNKQDKREVHFKFEVKDRLYKGSKDIDQNTFDKLKAGMNYQADIKATVSDVVAKNIETISLNFKL
ncbi:MULTISPECIES: hypothetical protein [unclassified Vibrio]|uniref:hypothetical protein n=1 Tax=unclassified Vibrio TaxID=2614977 RepID=UPI000C837B94|nr:MULTISPECIES: hypothetical protein [unclassified Vibrio]PMI91322.1 hypothetical protein BCU34_21830 [Vibrio sp. 10N.286.45.E10]PTQ19038.1 hypothetical protein CWO24_23460 [Vibrio sp. 10N.286.46.E10]